MIKMEFLSDTLVDQLTTGCHTYCQGSYFFRTFEHII